MREKKGIILTGILVGIAAVTLVAFGNPKNMGFCIACFIRDISGGLGLHRAEVVQYIRPEVIGLVLGAFILSLLRKEFKPRGGSSPLTRLVIGFFVMIGALIFLGCPFRMILRLAGGDLNAVTGLIGYVIGIVIGLYFINKGFSLKRSYKANKFEGYVFPVINIVLLVLLITAPSFIYFSVKGPGASHAPIILSLLFGLAIGAVAFKTRLCMVGGVRDLIFYKNYYLPSGLLAIFLVTLVGNIITGNFNLSFVNQPIAHNDHLWNFLGMVIVGWGSALLGGCPFRQLILAGSGSTDSAITLIGFALGGAFAHNFGIAASPAGVNSNGQITVVIILGCLLLISLFNKEQEA